MSLRIAIDLSCLLPQPLTGVGYYTLNQVEALLALEEELSFHVFASSAGGAPDSIADLRGRCASVRTVRWPTRLKVPLWTRLQWPPIESFTGPVDVAHGAFHLLPASRHAKRVVTIFDLTGVRHPDTHTAQSNAVHLRMLRHAARYGDAFLAISQSAKDDAAELLGIPSEKIHVAYGGVHMEEFDADLDTSGLDTLKARIGVTRPYFIHLGTLEPRKNIPRLLEAYARVKERHRDLPQLVLAGRKGWKYEPIFEAIERLRLHEDIIHTGYVPRNDAVLLLKGAYACVYPSLYEGFGLPVLEAMAARTPVLTSNTSSLPEVIGDTGITVSPTSVEAIRDGLVRLIEDYGDARARADAAYQRARGFTWRKSAEAVAGVYRLLADR